jgi:hypothetical protein
VRKLPDNIAKKVTTIPLGYHWNPRIGAESPLDKTPSLPFRSLHWSFIGTDWQGRKTKVTSLQSPELTAKATFLEDWHSSDMVGRDKYMEQLLNSWFIPCPGGINPETFRFYEALEAGAVPILVGEDRALDYLEFIKPHIDVIPIKDWTHAREFMLELVRKKDLLETYRARILTQWTAWKRRCANEVQAILAT